MENRMVRVDEESLNQIRFLAENLFDVPATQGIVVENALKFLWEFLKDTEPELWDKYMGR